MNVLSYSQTYQDTIISPEILYNGLPKKVSLNEQKGLFISFYLMDSISNKLIDLNSCVNENYLLQKQIEKEIKAKESLREYISLDKVEIANLNKEIKDRVEIEKINNETIIALENDIKYFRKKGNVKLIKGVLIGVTATGLLILGLSL